MNHIIDDNNNDNNQKNDLQIKYLFSKMPCLLLTNNNFIDTYADIKMIMRMGSLAIVKQNMAKGGPKAMKVHPKNSVTVIVES